MVVQTEVLTIFLIIPAFFFVFKKHLRKSHFLALDSSSPIPSLVKTLLSFCLLLLSWKFWYQRARIRWKSILSPLWSLSMSPPTHVLNFGIYLFYFTLKLKEKGMYSVAVQSLDSMYPLGLVDLRKNILLHPDELPGKPIRSLLS